MSRKKYNFDAVNLSKGFFSTIEKSCLTNNKTIEILAKNDTLFIPSRFRIVDLTGVAKFELPEKENLFSKLFNM